MAGRGPREWRPWAGWDGPSRPGLEPLVVRRTAAGVEVEFADLGRVSAEERAALAAGLARRLGVPVTVSERRWPSEPPERFRVLMAETGGALGALLAGAWQPAASGEGWDLVLPGEPAASLFRRWGGLERLQAYWPDLPPLQVTVAVPAPAPPPEPVTLPAPAVPPAPGWRAGKGRADGPVLPLAEVLSRNGDNGPVVVTGTVFGVTVRNGREGVRHATFGVGAGNSALKAHLVLRTGEEPPEEGSQVRLKGTVAPDRFSGEPTLEVREGLAVAEPAAPADDGAPEPRVELHCHTKMSAMDSVADLEDLFRKAARLGHPALAITDHAVAQAFPEAAALGRKWGVRPLYGIEVHMVEDQLPVLTGPPAGLPEAPVVVVDLETTGLTPRTHEAIEIGAVKLAGGEVIDRFHALLQPEGPVSRASLQITGLTERELERAEPPAEVWARFFAFARGAVLAAHNAPFDLGFIRAAHRRYQGSSLAVPVLDTLVLARALLPDLKGYGLATLTDHFRVPLTRHHRALADAEATALVLLRLLEGLAAAAGREGDSWRETDLRRPWPMPWAAGRPMPAVLLVRHQHGLEQLYRLISRSHLETFYRVPRVLRSQVQAGRQGPDPDWLVGAPVHGGELADLLWRGAEAEEFVARAADYDYWEVAPPDALRPWLEEAHLAREEAVRALLEDLVAWGERLGKPVVAVGDVHYVEPEDAIGREILAVTAKGELHDAGAALHYRTTGEMLEAFAWLGPARRQALVVDNPRRLAEELAPVTPVPETLSAPRLPEAESVVSEMPYARAREWYGDPLPPLVQERLDKEVQAILRHGFASIYYIAHRLVRKSLEDGYLVGSRGSVGSSLVATLLSITEVNPLPPHYRCPACRFTEFVTDGRVGSGYDLPPRPCPRCGTALIGDGQDIPFETFLGFEGDKVPDIDLNFSGEYQPEIHRYTEELFGQGKVFRAGTIATVASLTAFGLVKAWARETGRDLPATTVEWLARRLVGVKRTTGQHPGGLMIVPQEADIHAFTPVQHPADDREADVVTTHFDYHAISSRLLKLDLLGHDDPTAIRMLERLTGIPPREVPFQDPATMSLFSGVEALGLSDPDQLGSSVGSLGLPEFGTRFVRGMLEETRPRTFAELVRISGLSHGTEVWANNAQELIRRKVAGLSEVIATRDDIMTYLISKGLPPREAFAISESVRKGKGLKPEHIARMQEHGVPDWYVESCQKISYLFPKAHAAAYVMMGWRIAWFKVHHPLAFYATYFSVRADDFEPEPFLGGVPAINARLQDIEAKGNEATAKERSLVTVLEVGREMLLRGFHFEPVDLERSDARQFLMRPQARALLMPFIALPGLGASQAEAIVAARAEGPFLSVEDLRERARLNRTVIDLLRRAGALGDLGETNQLAFF